MTNLLNYNFTISTTSPPDAGDALEEDDTVYVCVVHKSSPDYK
jgi:hypothetical protein